MTLRIFVLFILSIFTFSLSAQTKINTDSVLSKKVAQEVCKCFGNLNNFSSNSLEASMFPPEIEECMNYTLFRFRKEFNYQADLTESDYTPEIGKKMGNRIGMRTMPYLMRNCKPFFELLVVQMEKSAEAFDRISEEKTETDDSIVEEPVEEVMADSAYVDTSYTDYDESSYIFKGKIKTIETKTYPLLVVENEKGEVEKFLFQRYQEEMDKILKNLKKYRGKKVRVEWYSSEFYTPKTKKYETYKELSWLELIEE